MNINPDTLTHIYALAHDSGKVELVRLAKALALVPKVVKTFTHVYTDKSLIEEYFVPGSAHTGYSLTVRNGKTVSRCTCRDHEIREVAWCKHRAAIALIVRSQQIDPQSVTANPPMVTPVEDREYRHMMLDKIYGTD